MPKKSKAKPPHQPIIRDGAGGSRNLEGLKEKPKRELGPKLPDWIKSESVQDMKTGAMRIRITADANKLLKELEEKEGRG